MPDRPIAPVDKAKTSLIESKAMHTEIHRGRAITCEVQIARNGAVMWRCEIEGLPTALGVRSSTSAKVTPAEVMVEAVGAAHRVIDRALGAEDEPSDL